jgi:serine/threonine-protein kinase RsbW
MSDAVTLQIPPSAAYAGVLRYVASTLAAQAKFDIDRVEDARLAVDEALNFMLPHATGSITCIVALDGQALTMQLTTSTNLASLPSTNTFGWIVLQSLTQMVQPNLEDQRLWIDMRLEFRSSVDA